MRDCRNTNEQHAARPKAGRNARGESSKRDDQRDGLLCINKRPCRYVLAVGLCISRSEGVRHDHIISSWEKSNCWSFRETQHVWIVSKMLFLVYSV